MRIVNRNNEPFQESSTDPGAKDRPDAGSRFQIVDPNARELYRSQLAHSRIEGVAIHSSRSSQLDYRIFTRLK